MIRIIIEKIPSVPGLCPFHNTNNHKCLIKRHLGFSNKKCQAWCGHSWNESCPYLMSFDEAVSWREKRGHIPNEFARNIYNIQDGKLPHFNTKDVDTSTINEESPVEKIINPHRFTKRRFGR